jgi:hypothetical protein
MGDGRSVQGDVKFDQQSRIHVGFFGEWEFSCDRQATMDAYARAIHGRSEVCVCNGCRHFVAARA